MSNTRETLLERVAEAAEDYLHAMKWGKGSERERAQRAAELDLRLHALRTWDMRYGR